MWIPPIDHILITNQKMTYSIYCDKHTPLKLRRTLEISESKQKSDIFKFCRAIERYYQLYSSEETKAKSLLLEPKAHSSLVESSTLSQKLKKSSKKTETNYFDSPFMTESKRKYLSLVEEWRKKVPSMLYTITLAKTRFLAKDKDNNIVKEDGYTVIDTHTPRRNPHKKLGADDEVWFCMPYKNLTPTQKFKKYKKIINSLKAQELQSTIAKPLPKKIRTEQALYEEEENYGGKVKFECLVTNILAFM